MVSSLFKYLIAIKCSESRVETLQIFGIVLWLYSAAVIYQLEIWTESFFFLLKLVLFQSVKFQYQENFFPLMNTSLILNIFSILWSAHYHSPIHHNQYSTHSFKCKYQSFCGCVFWWFAYMTLGRIVKEICNAICQGNFWTKIRNSGRKK